MNNQEYDQKKKECWKECAAEVAVETTNLLCKAIAYSIFDRAYALGKQTETISQEEIEKASVEYANKTAKQYEVCNSEFVQEIMVAFEQGVNFALGKQEKDVETVIQGWVCRDNNSLNAQVLIGDKPKRTGYNYWENKSADCISLPKDSFPDLTWESDPQPVEIIIKRKKNGEINNVD